jgi:hypothetical protein
MARTPLLTLALASAILVASLPTWAGADADLPVCDQRAPTFRPYIRLGDGFGYEPSIETDSKGTIYVMAHKLSLAAESSGANTWTASWLWRSVDDGRTFTDMKGLEGGTKLAWALEGDGAVDAMDRFYYVDTWATENHFSRWSDRGATLDLWRPGVASIEPLDDRPWVAAHGDGFVYYMSNQGVGAGPRQRLTIHRSTDAGMTFDPLGFSFPNSLWGFIDADPNSPYVYAFMDETNSSDMVAWASPDRGLTWSRHVVGPVSPAGSASNYGFPPMAVSPLDGTVYVFYDDDKRLYLGESKDHGTTWTVHDVTPFNGYFAHPWVSVAPNGDVGLVFDARPNNGSANYVYGMIWRPTSDCLQDAENPASVCTGPSRIFSRLQPQTVPTQEHFIQVEMMPDGRLAAPWEASGGHIRFTMQDGGPNLDGNPTCGQVGTP